MRTANLEWTIAQATHDAQTSAIGKAVAASVEVGVIVPSVLRQNLKDAGFKIVTDLADLSSYGFASTKHLVRVVVEDKKGNLVAMGAAGNADEAILHAMLGYFRENPVGDTAAPEPLAVVPG